MDMEDDNRQQRQPELLHDVLASKLAGDSNITEELYMKHNENSRMYEADDGKMLVRKSDSKVIGDGICLGESDDISNYEEREFTEEQRAQFFKDIGMEDSKKKKKNKESQRSHSRDKKSSWQSIKDKFMQRQVKNDNNTAIK